MGIYKTSGIVLASQDWRETSNIVTLYTRGFGKINAIVKGLKTKKGKGAGGLDQFSENEIIFYRKRSGLHLIDKWSLKSSNYRLYGGFKKFIVASIIAEMVIEYIEEEEKNIRIYELLNKTIKFLSEGNNEELFLAGFTIHFLKALGYKPNLDRCFRCKNEEFQESVFFSLREGSIVCNKCKMNRDKLVVLKRETLGAVRYLQNTMFEKSIHLKIEPSFQKRICDFLILFLSYTLGKEIKSVSFLETAII